MRMKDAALRNCQLMDSKDKGYKHRHAEFPGRALFRVQSMSPVRRLRPTSWPVYVQLTCKHCGALCLANMDQARTMKKAGTLDTAACCGKSTGSCEQPTLLFNKAFIGTPIGTPDPKPKPASRPKLASELMRDEQLDYDPPAAFAKASKHGITFDRLKSACVAGSATPSFRTKLMLKMIEELSSRLSHLEENLGVTT